MQNGGKLYIVATPIGNLGDITFRAITVLNEVQWIAAEDTRHSKKLLAHYGINTALLSVHAHNERAQISKILNWLSNHQSVAYITDAGTPLISDPGAYLVQAVREQGYEIVPIPGPCAAITALSASGFTDPHFFFEGFLPNRLSERKQRLQQLKDLPCTIIFYESPHRIMAALSDMLDIFGARHAVIARELTKKYETIKSGPLNELYKMLNADTKQQLGEFVLLVSGKTKEEKLPQEKIEALMSILLKELSLKKAVLLGSDLLGVSKNELYTFALQLKNKG